MQLKRSHTVTAVFAVAPLLLWPTVAHAATVANPSTSPQCMNNTAFFNPTLPSSIVLPPGFTASVFATGLNMPTGIAFLGNSSSFQVLVLESGHGLPSVCNDETLWPGGEFDINNPFTPDILVFNQNGTKIRGPLASRPPAGAGSSLPGRRSTSPLLTALPEGSCSRPIPINRLISTTGTTTARASSP